MICFREETRFPVQVARRRFARSQSGVPLLRTAKQHGEVSHAGTVEWRLLRVPGTISANAAGLLGPPETAVPLSQGIYKSNGDETVLIDDSPNVGASDTAVFPV